MSEYIVVHSIKVATEFVPETFGRLTTIGPKFWLPVGKSGGRKARQVCQCECGNTIVTTKGDLLSGRISSCGCLQKEKAAIRATKHGMCGTTEYQSWQNMKERCYRSSNNHYKDYGGRGIVICDRWLDPENGFANFYADTGAKPTTLHEIERKNVNGNYCPENCCWATAKEQARNKRSNIVLEYNGKTQCLAAWAEETGINYGTLRSRVKSGWPVERILNTEKRPK